MDFPDFRDFLDLLDGDTIAGIMKDANNASKLVSSMRMDDPQDLPGGQILAISYQMALSLLAFYHSWLEQQL